MSIAPAIRRPNAAGLLVANGAAAPAAAGCVTTSARMRTRDIEESCSEHQPPSPLASGRGETVGCGADTSKPVASTGR
jgi:hypothetical protein